MWITTANYRATPVECHAASPDSYSMTERQRTLTPPVQLMDPYGDLTKEPVADCDVCTALVTQRAEARERRDYAAAAIASTEIACHPHNGRRRRP
ncbi:hypothetical protein HEK616_40300 [Streptomyces nigrescens]|uniref:Uncharacterized protein n=1 Tax=Streptomyces nigrescens TaxID=1920 RepID=A0ABM7ZW27_STRNI|nr:hypothetical protein HEK616_40300 [Streptomyces nigrescens]